MPLFRNEITVYLNYYVEAETQEEADAIATRDFDVNNDLGKLEVTHYDVNPNQFPSEA